MSTCITIDESRRMTRAGFCIDGCSVDQLLEDVYRACWDQMALRDLDLRPQIIAWDPLCVAADSPALLDLFVEVVKHVGYNTEEGVVHIRAFPSHDDVFVIFEIQNERPARRTTDRVEAFNSLMERARISVESMGGEVAEYSSEDGGSRVCFKLPQWV